MRSTVCTEMMPRGNRHARRMGSVLLALLHLGTACVAYVPPRTTVGKGTLVRLELSDTGRVAHAARLGPGIRWLTGTVRDRIDDRQLVEVTGVTPIGGQELPVSGIQVLLAPGDVSGTAVRTISRTRTTGVIGATLAVIVTFFATKGFRSGYTPPATPSNPGGRDQ